MLAVDRQIIERSNEYLLPLQAAVQDHFANDPASAISPKYAGDFQTRRDVEIAEAAFQERQ